VVINVNKHLRCYRTAITGVRQRHTWRESGGGKHEGSPDEVGVEGVGWNE
jgi:hypothetical protein